MTFHSVTGSVYIKDLEVCDNFLVPCSDLFGSLLTNDLSQVTEMVYEKWMCLNMTDTRRMARSVLRELEAEYTGHGEHDGNSKMTLY